MAAPDRSWSANDTPSTGRRQSRPPGGGCRESAIFPRIMSSRSPSAIPNRLETLRVLRLMGDFEPILMLAGSDDGFGTRWTLSGQQVQPAIAGYLMEAGYVSETGKTELGARQLSLTADGKLFRDHGVRWWESLSLFEKLKVTLLG